LTRYGDYAFPLILGGAAIFIVGFAYAIIKTANSMTRIPNQIVSATRFQCLYFSH
jgi:hypothetical protein